MRIVLSHAAADKPLVNAVVNLLETGIGIPSDAIFCTSFDEQGIPAGEDFAPYMRMQLAEKSDVVIAIVTPQYYASPFCMCETGAAWAMAKKFIPLLVEPVGYNDLRGALYGKQGILLNDGKKLDAMRDGLDKLFPGGKVTRWNRKKDEFLEALPPLIQSLKKSEGLSKAEADKLRADLEAARNEALELDEEKEQLQQRVAALEKLKDAKQVEAVRKQFSTDDAQFDDLVEQAQDALEDLPRVVRKAIFCETRGETFAPNFDEWGSALEDAIQRDYISDSGERLSVNGDHPPVSEALQKVRELSDFLEQTSSDFDKAYTKEHKARPNIASLTFWETHGLL